MQATTLPTLRRALRDLRAAVLPDWMVAADHIDLADGTHLEIFHPHSSDGGWLIGCHQATRYNARGEKIAAYRL